MRLDDFGWSRTAYGRFLVWTAALAALVPGCERESRAAGVDATAEAGSEPVTTTDAMADAETGSAAASGVPECSLFQNVAAFAVSLRESSGLARSSGSDAVLWTHNDSGGDASLAAIDLSGRTLGVVTIAGARNRDWEDLASGPCPEGTCLFIGDIGDNLNERDPVTIYRVPEPAVDAGRSARARAWSVRYPGGPRDAEGLAVHPTTGEVWIVSKGRAHPVQVFRVPLPEDGESTVAEPVVSLTRGATPGRRMVTGATFTPDGRWLLVRSYTELVFLPVDGAGVPGPAAEPAVDLTGLNESQGEAVEAFADGWVYFTSESGMAGSTPMLSRAYCEVG